MKQYFVVTPYLPPSLPSPPPRPLSTSLPSLCQNSRENIYASKQEGKKKRERHLIPPFFKPFLIFLRASVSTSHPLPPFVQLLQNDSFDFFLGLIYLNYLPAGKKRFAQLRSVEIGNQKSVEIRNHKSTGKATESYTLNEGAL